MSFFDKFNVFKKTSEADVMGLVVKIRHGLEYAAHEVEAAYEWLFDHADEIAGAVATVAGVVSTLSGAGVTIPPSVLTAVKDANVAVAGLNALVEAQQKGSATPQALVEGYVAAQQAWVAAEKATLAVTTDAKA